MPKAILPKFSRLLSACLLLVGVSYGAWALLRPLPPIAPQSLPLSMVTTGPANDLRWPAQGQAAVGINPSGVLAMHGAEQPVPIASTAKVLTALMVLKKHPLALGQTGPKITITNADVQLYNNYVAADGSVTAVTVGETLTEYQMLQAILLPSANNIADSLAIWAFGSLSNYATFTNNYIRQLGLTHTQVGGDASGYDPSTVSTAHDLVLLGEAAMQQPVLAEIVGQASATLPVAGVIENVNGLLGTQNIIGVKTGNTDAAGGVFLAAQQATIGGKRLTLIAAVVGTSTLREALINSLPLLASAQQNFVATTVVPAKTTVGKYTTAWGGTVSAVTHDPVSALVWKGSTVTPVVNLLPLAAGSVAGTKAGTLQLPESSFGPAQTAPVTLSGSISQPNWVWRLMHPTKN